VTSVRHYFATKVRVLNRGVPPDSFLDELIDWGKAAPEEIFAPNPNPADIYAYIRPVLGPWENLLHRRAGMLEAMRVHAGFESSWDWNEGVDVSNPHSQHHKEGEETGIFQVSFDSTYLSDRIKAFAVEHGIGTVGSFIPKMKSNHQLAMEYYARLVRENVQWAGPIKRHEIDIWLSRAAVAEFMRYL
jgi:hypothetical protein